MFGIIGDIYHIRKVRRLVAECEAACLALDAKKARETYERFRTYPGAADGMARVEYLTWRGQLAPMVLALEGKPNGDPTIKFMMETRKGELTATEEKK